MVVLSRTICFFDYNNLDANCEQVPISTLDPNASFIGGGVKAFD